MNINEFFLMAFMTVMTAANFFIYKLTRDKYLETMQRIWNWESYIRRLRMN